MLSEQFPKRKISFFAPNFIKYNAGKFSNEVEPDAFLSVRITGKNCSLNCSHCGGAILDSMEEVKNEDELFNFCNDRKSKGCKGILISGASDSNGSVPLIKFKDAIRRIKDELNLKIVVHTGIVDSELANALSYSKVDAAMFDVVGDKETLNKVCNLNYSIDIFKESLDNLTAYDIPAVPHIVVGLHFGEIRGENKALELLSNYDMSSLVLVVLNPIKGTEMENVTLPHVEKISEIFNSARQLFLHKPVLLGCARPVGEIRERIEELAVLNKFDGIAFPSDKTIELTEKENYSINYSYNCCSLYPDALQCHSCESGNLKF